MTLSWSASSPKSTHASAKSPANTISARHITYSPLERSWRPVKSLKYFCPFRHPPSAFARDSSAGGHGRINRHRIRLGVMGEWGSIRPSARKLIRWEVGHISTRPKYDPDPRDTYRPFSYDAIDTNLAESGRTPSESARAAQAAQLF